MDTESSTRDRAKFPGTNVCCQSPRISYSISSIMLAVYTFTVVAFAGVSAESADLSRMVGIAMVLAFLTDFVLAREARVLITRGTAMLLLYVCWDATSGLWAGNHALATLQLKRYIQLAVFAVVAANIMIARRSIMPAIVGFLAGLIWATITAFYNLESNVIFQGGRVGSTLAQPNLFANALTVGILLCLYLYKHTTKLRSLMSVGLIMLFIYQIFFFTGSRQGMMSALLAIGVFFAIFYGLNARLKPHYWLLICASTFVGYFAVGWLIENSPYSSRLLVYEDDSSFEARTRLTNFGLETWKRNPILGYGSNQYRELLRQNVGRDAYAHNNYVELLVNNGLIGFVLYYSFYLVLLYHYRQLYISGQASIPHIAWAITVIIVLLALDFAAVASIWKSFWITFAILIAHQHLLTQQHSSPASQNKKHTEPHEIRSNLHAR